VSSDEFATKTFMDEDRTKINRKRYVVLILLFTILGVVFMVDGFFVILQYASNNGDSSLNAATMLSYYITCFSLSLCIFSGMIHAKIHTFESDRLRLAYWIGLTVLWMIISFTSIIPSIVGVSASNIITEFFTNFGLVCILGLSFGVLLHIQGYFHSLKADKVSNYGELFISWGVFTFSIAQAMICSFFL
jgi:uncharacterized membrane protein YhaH (DUF805 family)